MMLGYVYIFDSCILGIETSQDSKIMCTDKNLVYIYIYIYIYTTSHAQQTHMQDIFKMQIVYLTILCTSIQLCILVYICILV